MRATLLLVGVLALGFLAPAGIVQADEQCAPYPIGRCGLFDREAVVFCYVVQSGIMRSASDASAIALGSPLPQTGALLKGFYVRPGPAQAFVADPYNTPLPTKSLYQESNSVGGLQTVASFRCAQFVWFAECDSWMGPYGVLNKVSDTLVL